MLLIKPLFHGEEEARACLSVAGHADLAGALVYRALQGGEELGFVVFTVADYTLTIEALQVHDAKDLDVVDGLLKAAIAYGMDHDALYLHYVEGMDQALLHRLNFWPDTEKSEFSIIDVLNKCKHCIN